VKTQRFDRVALGSGPAPIGEGRGLYQVDLGTRDRVAVLAASGPGARLEDPAFDLIHNEHFDLVATLESSAMGAAVAHSYSETSDSIMEASAAIYSLMAQGGWDESPVMVFCMTHANVKARSGSPEHRVGAWVVVRVESIGEIEVERHTGWDAVMADLASLTEEEEAALLLINVDWMMAFNDWNGHTVGDLVLARVHSCIANEALSSFTQRVGGDLFAVVCRRLRRGEGASPEAAISLAESLRAKVEAMNIPHEHSAVKTAGRVTVSVGVLDSVPPSLRNDATALKSEMHDIVYKAKREGRNRVAVGPR
jgi:diguanylate cyclase (GGDEF)-like protein